jgi:hypothetical protein
MGENRMPDSSTAATATAQGDAIVLVNMVGTIVFTITAITAAGVFSTATQWVGAITAMGLFLIGVFAFLWSFWNVVQRSRTEQIAVTQVYLLIGPPTPARTRRVMLAMLTVQITVGLTTALTRTRAENGSPGTSLAVGVLVPMFGIGMNGLWAAYHGVFPPRDDLDDPESATSTVAIDKNDRHG